MATGSRRREDSGYLVDIAVDRSSDLPIARQLFLAIRSAILGGRLQASARLPSTRTAARLWNVGRGTVIEAYDTLLAEGFVSGRLGSGTYVAADVPSRASRSSRRAPGRTGAARSLSRAAAAIAREPRLLDVPPQDAFVMGRAVLDERTRSVLKRIGNRHLAVLADHYGNPQGEGPLREAVSIYLRAARGVRCDPDRIFITAGSQQAIDLAVRTLIDPGDVVAIENPSYPPARLAVTAHNARLSPVPVDDNGLEVSVLAGLAERPRAVYVTPSHQYPTGAVLSMARRLALLDWATSTGAWIIEDDYDSEFRYDERPLAALQGIDEHNRVIYIGTFSKALLPGLRIGYLVVPIDLVPAFRAMRALLDRFPAPFHQLVVADFLAEGHFSGHLRRLRDAYRASRDMLVALLQERLAGHLQVGLPRQGIHLLARLGAGRKDVVLAQDALRARVTVVPVSPMHIGPKPPQGLVFGFAGLTSREADLGTRRLAKVFEQGGTTGRPLPL